MLDDQLLISELAKRTGVSVRTIRFYITEGLLPQPQARGRYSLYDEEYLTRIELIKRLKSVYLPLKEIKHMVESLTKGEIETMLQQLSEASSQTPSTTPQEFYQRAETSPSGTEPSTGSRYVRENGLPEALDYISKLLQSQTRFITPFPLPMPAPLSQPLQSTVMPQTVQPESDPDASQPNDSETSWRRFVLQPGVELLVSEEVYHQSASSIHEIIAQTKLLFAKFPSGGKNV